MNHFRSALIIIISIGFSIVGWAQRPDQRRIDSLLRVIDQSAKDTGKVSMLNECSYLLSRTNPQKGLMYGKQALALAEELNWPRGQVVALANAALCNNVLEDSASARNCALRSMAIARNINDTPGQVMALTKLGYVAFVSRRQKMEARAYGTEALALALRINDKKTRAFAYMHMGFLLDKKGEFNDAVHFDSLAIQLFDSLDDRYSQAGALCNLGIEFSMMHDYAREVEIDNRALTLLTDYDSSEYKAITLICLSDSYYQMHDYTKALAPCLEGLAIDTRLGKKSIMADDHQRAAMAYIKLGKYEEALRHTNAAMELEMKIGDLYGRWTVRRLQKRIAKHMPR
ncbi:tetratricopeptide repeat protein [Flavipsychrobacter stenotrophus]|nr:hypothetical protein [Flavipsychrobacter stenotrophus]